ncbi:MAG TPA: hypothetical protein DCM28_06795 [Phycisphaerales bacterium]|nr:hypothetical protein [Phycisphaerales bacterium]
MKNCHVNVILGWAGFCLLLCTANVIAQVHIEPITPHDFFVTPMQSTTLRWQSDLPQGSSIPCTLRDYQNRPQPAPTAKVVNGQLQLTVTLAQGYYDLQIGSQSFGIISQPGHTGKVDDYFGMDVVLTWLERRDEKRPVIVKMLQRSGIGFARDRFRWSGVNPKLDQWNWNEHDHADQVRKLYAAHGIKVLEMFHDPGPARGTFPVASRLPQNLLPVPNAWPVIHQRWLATWGGLEVWNEPDGGYGSDLPADQYAPLVHAMHWTFKDRDGVAMPIGGGVLIGNNPGTYEDFLARNGMFDSVDFVSFHDYRRAVQLENLIADYRAWLKRYDRQSKPLWLTECGYPWAKGSGRASRDEDANSAWQIAAKSTIAKANGIAHYFPFCMPFYEEGGTKSFSMIGKELTPLRSMAAYVQNVRVLSHQQYIGDLQVNSKANLTAQVFAGQTQQAVVVLIADSLAAARVILPLSPTRVEAVDGQAIKMDEQNTFTFTDGLAYAWVDRDALKEYLKIDTRAMQHCNVAKKPVNKPVLASPIILQHELDPRQVNYSTARYIVLPGHADALNLNVKVTNLDTVAHQVKAQLILPGQDDSATGQTQSVELPPQSMRKIHWQIDASALLNAVHTEAIVVKAVDETGQAAAPLAMPFRLEGELSTLLASFPKVRRLDVNDVSAWQKNMAGHGTQKLKAMDFVGKSGIQMDVRFAKPGERWFYPKLLVNNNALDQAQGLIVRLRTTQKAAIRLMLFENTGGGYWISSPIVPADGKWHVAYVGFAEFLPLPSHPDMVNGRLDVGQVKYISVGMHDLSEAQQNTMQISDLLVVCDQ